jgi:hypothetical protein
LVLLGKEPTTVHAVAAEQATPVSTAFHCSANGVELPAWSLARPTAVQADADTQETLSSPLLADTCWGSVGSTTPIPPWSRPLAS